MKNILSGRWGIDSNLLIYVQNQESPFHRKTKELFLLCAKKQLTFVLTQQNIVECERVLVQRYRRPIKDTVDDLNEIIQAFSLEILTPITSTYQTFQKLIVQGLPRAIDFFDYYLAATLIDNGIPRLLTVNTLDFAGIDGFEAKNPF